MLVSCEGGVAMGGFSILRVCRFVCLVCALCGCVVGRAAAPSLMLANSYHEDIHLADYWVSEKFDGVRAYWDGAQLVSRQGRVFAVPAWFLAQLPPEPLDGELWMGRGQFEATSAAVRRQVPKEHEWRRIRYMVFDAPQAEGNFDQRLQTLRQRFASDKRSKQSLGHSSVELVPQIKIHSHAALMQHLHRVIQNGGEGLMLHLGNAPYRGVRSDDLLKLKQFQDAEATVIAYIAGQGANQGKTGALRVRTADGIEFNLGSGLTQAQRTHPPAIGALVTYRFTGYTQTGIPRFAHFVRVRQDL